MPKVSTFTVVPKLPPALEPLLPIARNLWWCWDHEAIELFYRIDRNLWDSTSQNPVSLLGQVTQERLGELSTGEGFLARRALERHVDGIRRPHGEGRPALHTKVGRGRLGA